MTNHTTRDRYVGITLLLAVAGLTIVGAWKISGPSAGLVAVKRQPQAIMGTSCTLAAVVPRNKVQKANDALDDAEAVLRQTEARMSSWLDDSEISRFNQADAHRPVALSPEVIKVLILARDAHQATGGAFDVTCRPSVELWKHAGKQNRLPTNQQIRNAREKSHWKNLTLNETAASKDLSTAEVDLGGIAKGYAIDRALAALRDTHVAGGLVDVGGDVACFGRRPDGRAWPVDVQNPFGPGIFATLLISEGAVCTSGNYARFQTIAGQSYSHILDPRTGRPANAAASVTVLAPNAVTADVWATALSVLGPEGFVRLPEGVEVLLIAGTGSGYKVYCTPGMVEVLEGSLPVKPVVIE